ncbi:MAG TPA: CxxxxCH/CxxCH domain-containing protein [Anaeromyxobacteraceae bacterium]|nr:CxxxxCH/CxxCH domain-containing protein [Anaeromyxobacteraceae bacterium]
MSATTDGGNAMKRTRNLGASTAPIAAAILAASAACQQGTWTAAPVPEPAVRAAPYAAELSSGLVCVESNVHAKHVNRFACATCHPAGGAFGFAVPYTFPSGVTSTAGGTLTLRTATTPTTCTVACHFPKGAPAHPVEWTTPGPLACTECHATTALPPTHPSVPANATRDDCQVCHVMTGHMDGTVAITGHGPEWVSPASPANLQFHAYGANAGLTSCQRCHGQDLSGGVALVSCASCHDGAGPGAAVTLWGSCTMCHGGTDGQTGAPPDATWGNAGDAVRVGAHTTHLAASAIAPALDCDVCHVKPADALAGGHVDGGTAEVTFSGLATARLVATPSWDRTAARCSNVYCHGGALAGGSNTAPVWTRVGMGEAACGTCHGLPPPAPHPTVSGGLTACSSCHAATVDAAGTVIPPRAGGKHLDGLVEATGGHPASWMDPASTGFHAYSANAGLSACQSCHGAALDGVGGSTTRSCASCHDGVTAKLWNSCTMCHGGVDNQTGAPPEGTWGHESEAARVGAHTRHVTATAKKVAYDCTECHLKPASALSAGHVDGSAVTVTWGALARTGGASPAWDRAAGTCGATYCHGNYSGTYTYWVYDWGSGLYEQRSVAYAGKAAGATWSGAALGCDACHGNPPSAVGAWHSGLHGGGLNAGAGYNACQYCHPDAATSAGTNVVTSAAQHVNGVVDVAPQWAGDCFNCH